MALAIVLHSAQDMRFVTKMSVASLLCDNCLVGIGYVVPQSIIMKWGDVIGIIHAARFCQVVIGIGLFGAIASIISLLCINCERYIFIEFPLRYHSWLTRRNAAIVMVIKWILLFSVLTLYITHVKGRPLYDSQWRMCVALPQNILPQKEQILGGAFFFITTFVILPGTVTVTIYARIVILVRRRIEKEKLTLGFPSRNNHSDGDRKASLTFMIVTICFTVTWLPFSVISFYRFVEMYHLYPQLEIVAYFTLSSSFWLTTVVYVSRDVYFKKAVAKICRCITRND